MLSGGTPRTASHCAARPRPPHLRSGRHIPVPPFRSGRHIPGPLSRSGRHIPGPLSRSGRHVPGPLSRSGRHALDPPCQVQQAPQLMLSGLAAMILAAIVGLVCFVVVADQRRAPSGREPGVPSARPFPAALASRALDPEPLTQHELFPAAEIHPGALTPGELFPATELRPGPYRVEVTNRDRDCAAATGGELGPLLHDLGCSQVVRAGLTAPYDGYRVTAGILNLADADAAQVAADHAQLLVDRGRGDFLPLGGPPGQASWQPWGHYLLYAVVARPDAAAVPDDDPYAARISTEIVEQHLKGTVLSARAGSP